MFYIACNIITLMEKGLQLDHHLCFHLYTASRLMQRIYRPYFDEWGITYPQYLVLVCLWEQDGQTVSDLSEPLDLDSGTLSPLLRRMENAGFVQKQHAEDDYRKVHITLTQKGRDLEHEAVKMQSQLRQELRLNAQDLEALNKIMSKLGPEN